jgi:hypothetical protein
VEFGLTKVHGEKGFITWPMMLFRLADKIKELPQLLWHHLWIQMQLWHLFLLNKII